MKVVSKAIHIRFVLIQIDSFNFTYELRVILTQTQINLNKKIFGTHT
jgi:hypothetical protein